MGKKLYRFTLLLLIMTLFISACSSSGAEKDTGKDKTKDSGEELNIALSAAPPNMDPHLSVAIITGQIALNIFETLVAFDSNYEIQPSLAESIDISEDGTTYTFPLRDVAFHNGEKLQSEDVIASLERWGRLSPIGKSAMADITLEAPDEKTVVLKLISPSNTILYDLAFPTSQAAYIMPKEIIDQFGDDIMTEYIGTGPYQFAEWKPDQFIHVTKYEDYQNPEGEGSGLAGAKEVSVNELYFHFVQDTSTRLNGLKSGQYDVAQALPTDQYESLKGDSDISTTIVKPALYPGLVFDNVEGIFTNQKARQGVLAALDMDEIMLASGGHKDFNRVDSGLVMPEQSTWYSDAGKDKYNQKNPEKAKKLLKEAGYNGELITIITTQDYDYIYNAALVVQDQLTKAGVNVNLEVFDWPTLLAKRNDRANWDAYVSSWVMVAQPTQTLFLDSRNEHPTQYNSAEMDALLNKIRFAPTHEEALSAWDEAQALYWEDVPLIKLGDYFQLNAGRKGLGVENMFSLDIYWNID
jgi:peptide/nickel transport system substrate-binding protein